MSQIKKLAGKPSHGRTSLRTTTGDALRTSAALKELAVSAGVASALGAELGDGGVQVAGVLQDDGVEDQAEGGELVLLALAAELPQQVVGAAGRRHGPGS